VDGLRVYRALLKNRPLTRLLLGEFISGIGDWLYIVAIFVVIYEENHDAAAVGLFGAVRLLPYVFLSVPAGAIADHFERRLVLFCSDIWRGSMMVIMAVLVAFNAPALPITIFAILAACGSTFFYPSMGAYLPSLVDDERQLGPANSAWASLGNISFILGPALGGVLLAFGSLVLPFVINAFSFVFIAWILWHLPKSSKASRAADAAAAAAGKPSSEGSGMAVAVGGFAAVEGEGPGAVESPEPASAAPVSAWKRVKLRPLAGFTLVQLMAGFFGGGFQVITTVLAIDILNAGPAGNGYLNAAIGIGGLIGGIAAGGLVLRRGLGMPLLVGAVIMGLGSVALGTTTNLGIALLWIGVSSAGGLVLDVVGTTLFQRLVPNELLGRGIGILMAITTLTGAVGGFLMPVLLIQAGPLPTLGVSGALAIVLTIAGVAVIGADGTRPETPYEAIVHRVAKLDLFTGVPNSRLEQAMHRLVEVPMVAGQAAVTQGETADRFYIIETGTFTVTQVQSPGAAPVVLRQLGPDQVFGELGLLNSAPRSATVTADTDGVLLALEGKDFLRLVGASGDLQGRLLGLYGGSGSGSR
jgi:MFS family permease